MELNGKDGIGQIHLNSVEIEATGPGTGTVEDPFIINILAVEGPGSSVAGAMAYAADTSGVVVAFDSNIKRISSGELEATYVRGVTNLMLGPDNRGINCYTTTSPNRNVVEIYTSTGTVNKVQVLGPITMSGGDVAFRLPELVGASGFARVAVSGSVATYTNGPLVHADLPAFPIATPTNANYTATAADRFIFFDTGNTNRTLTIPDPATVEGLLLCVKKVGSGTGTVTASRLVDGITVVLTAVNQGGWILAQGGVYRSVSF